MAERRERRRVSRGRREGRCSPATLPETQVPGWVPLPRLSLSPGCAPAATPSSASPRALPESLASSKAGGQQEERGHAPHARAEEPRRPGQGSSLGSIARAGQTGPLRGLAPGTGSAVDPSPPSWGPMALLGAGELRAAGARCRQAAVPGPWSEGSGAEKSQRCLTPRRSPARAAPVPERRKLLHKRSPSCVPT